MRRLLLAGILGLAGYGSMGWCAGETPLRIDRVFFAQQHVLEPDNPLFKLVGGLDALIKVQVYAETPTPSPSVVALLELDSRTKEIALQGPAMLPPRPTCDPVLMEHSYADSFTAIVPAEWVRSGLKVTVELREHNYIGLSEDDFDYSISVAANRISVSDRKVFDSLAVGAPTALVMQMFDVHYFGRGLGSDHPQGWERELEAKLPVASLTVHRARNLIFREIVMPPMFDGPSARYSSPEEFKERTGHDYDGEQGIALRWCAALKAAGGSFGLWRPYQINICGVHAGGQAGGYRGCSSMHRHGVVIHELGHTFGLPHWAGRKDYPYTRTMYGEDTGEPTTPNAGPTWAFDIGRRTFIAPRRMVDGKLDWKRDPMQGGGQSGLKEFMYNHFSDYSVSRMRHRFEEQAVYWDAESGQYARWNQESGAYDRIVENDGVQLPVERDAEVISVMASANAVVPDANIIYPPIGPYTAGLVRRFEADSVADREAAQAVGYTDETCSVCVRVTQGGAVKTYLMRAAISPEDDPLQAFNVSAINLPARDGDVTLAELLYCPKAVSEGVTVGSRVLYRWEPPAAAAPATRVAMNEMNAD